MPPESVAPPALAAATSAVAAATGGSTRDSVTDMDRAATRLAAVSLALAVSAWGACLPAGSPPETPVLADVVSVEAAGEPGAYRFAVGIESPDRGCGQYADFWEVVTPEGRLVFRRVLGHSHVDEQPFVRAGGPVALAADAVVRVRAHMHPTGYGGVVFEGSVESGFRPLEELPAEFAPELAAADPQPPPCAR